MKPIIRWGLQQRRWYTVSWMLGVSAFAALEISFFPSFRNQAAQLNQTFANLPPAVKSLIGDTGNYFSPDNYLNSRVFYLVIPILFAILMIGLGASLLGREENEGTIELLLARPLSRARLLLGKALCGLLITGIIAVGSLLITIGLSKVVGLPNSFAEISAAMLLSYLMCLIFGALAFMLTAVGGVARGLSIGVATAVFVASYVLTGLAGTVHWLQWPARFLPYYYFQPDKVLNGQYTWRTMAVFAAVSIALYLIGWVGFRRRDIGIG